MSETSPPLFIVRRLRVKGIEPTSRGYSSRHLEVEIEIPPDGNPRRALDLIDQAVAERLGVPPERLERAERVLEQLKHRMENAERAGNVEPESRLRAEKQRSRAAEIRSRLSAAQGDADAAEHNHQHAAAGVEQGAENSPTVQELADLAKEARRKRREVEQMGRDIDQAEAQARGEEDHAETCLRTIASAPSLADFQAAQDVLTRIKIELEENRAQLPF